MNIRDFDILNAFLGGKSVSDIAKDYGVTPQAIGAVLRKPSLRPELLKRVNTLANRVLEFKLDAFDGAETALKKLVYLSGSAKTEELQRLSSLDVVKIAGLMPRKRLLVETSQYHGIDQDTREWIDTVMKEVKSIEESVV